MKQNFMSTGVYIGDTIWKRFTVCFSQRHKKTLMFKEGETNKWVQQHR